MGRNAEFHKLSLLHMTLGIAHKVLHDEDIGEENYLDILPAFQVVCKAVEKALEPLTVEVLEGKNNGTKDD